MSDLAETRVVDAAERDGLCIVRLAHATLDAMGRRKGSSFLARFCARRSHQAAMEERRTWGRGR